MEPKNIKRYLKNFPYINKNAYPWLSVTKKCIVPENNIFVLTTKKIINKI